MERMSDVLGDHFDTRPPPGCQTPKLGRVVTLYLFPPILSMGHMIARLLAIGHEDASSELLTAGSPEIVRPGGKTNPGCATTAGRQYHNLQSKWAISGAHWRGDASLEYHHQTYVRDGAVHGSSRYLPSALVLFLQIQDSASWTPSNSLPAFHGKSPKIAISGLSSTPRVTWTASCPKRQEAEVS